MSKINLAVPPTRDKTPAPETRKPASGANPAKKKATGTKKTKGAEKTGPRAKSRSPNPSFCSVLSRVKDFELGVYTPKTALPNNVDILNPRCALEPFCGSRLDCKKGCWATVEDKHGNVRQGHRPPHV